MSKLGEVKGVEVFAAGVHKDVAYTVQDLDAMVENFNRLQSLLRPTVVVGHSESQEWLQDSGIPAAGTVTNLRRKGQTLLADFVEMPVAIAKLVNSRAYRACSSEVYSDFEYGGKRYGPTLRRVALLGGELPAVKTLADLPAAGYSETYLPPRRAVLVLRDVRRAGAGLLRCFSEVRPMAANAAPNADLVQMLTEVGMEPELAASVAGKLTPDEVAEVVRLAGGEVATPEPEEPMTAAEMAKANKAYRSHSEQRPAPMTAARREQLLKSSSLGNAVLRNEQKNRRR
ncbi:MAG: hypothetical protein JNM56_12910 [Planctomycetia bacterium]|nr:hypothetical protein [Planctomycetia bacterium]